MPPHIRLTRISLIIKSLIFFLGISASAHAQRNQLVLIKAEVATIDSLKHQIDNLDQARDTHGYIGCGDEGSNQIIMDSIRTYRIWEMYSQLSLEIDMYYNENSELIYKEENYSQEYERITYLKDGIVIREIETGNRGGLPQEVADKLK